MKIYLLNAPFVNNFVRCGRWQGVAARGGTLYFPIWLSYSTGVLEEAGHTVKLVDSIANKLDMDQILKDVDHFKPDMVVVDSNFSSLTNDCNIAKSISDYSGAISVLVGPPASQFSNEIIIKGVNIVARYEYDLTLREVANCIDAGENLEDIQGISYCENKKIKHNVDRALSTSEELDKIPFVSSVYKNHLNIKDYFLGHALHPMVQIFTGRGCPNQCTFCSWPETLMGRKYRIRSTKNVVDEFEYISKNIKYVKEIFIEDDTFTITKKRVKQICDEIKERDLKITWSCNARANLDYETMKMMAESGCRLLDVGFESGNEKILKSIKKGITKEEGIKFMKDANRAKLMVLADFIFGLPGETKETAKETINYAKKLKPNIVQFAVATPIPGTAFYDFCKSNGFLLTNSLEGSIDVNGFQKCIVSYPSFTNEDIQTSVNNALKEYYLSINYIPIFIKTILRKDGFRELQNIAISAKVFLNYLYRQGNKK